MYLNTAFFFRSLDDIYCSRGISLPPGPWSPPCTSSEGSSVMFRLAECEDCFCLACLSSASNVDGIPRVRSGSGCCGCGSGCSVSPAVDPSCCPGRDCDGSVSFTGILLAFETDSETSSRSRVGSTPKEVDSEGWAFGDAGSVGVQGTLRRGSRDCGDCDDVSPCESESLAVLGSL